MGAKRTHRGRLIVAPHARGDVGAGQARELHREITHASGGAGDQDPAPEQDAALGERVDRGETRHGERGGLRERHLVRQLGERVCRHRHALGPRALEHNAHDARAHARSGTVRRREVHDPGEIPAGSPARRGHPRAADLAAIE